MARFIEVAAIHFVMPDHLGMPPRTAALAQFRRARELLDGTGIDLIVTCEGMAAVGQAMDDSESPAASGPLLGAYADCARANRCTVVGSTRLREDDRVSNAQVVIGPDGRTLGIYRKTHPTADERRAGVHAGPGAVAIDTPAGRLGGVICFDLNFDDLRLAYRRLRPDLIAFSSMYHGGHLQAGWATGTRAFLAAACKDGVSEIRDPLGRVLASANGYGQIARARINLDRALVHLDGNQDRFPGIRRRHSAGVRIETDADLGLALVSCDDPGLDMRQLMEESGMIGLDDYLADCEGRS